MESGKTPKKPLTPFFLFREEEMKAGRGVGGKEAGAKWRDMSDKEKEKYIDEYKTAKEKFDAYLEEEGYARKSSVKDGPIEYSAARIKAICGTNEEIKGMSTKNCKALGRLLVKKCIYYA
jgi:hypothetical protein